ncbi:MAG: lysozyme inhibitor LprI family protein [Pseudomonadota bacterium]|nr:lysozyme inhibitor LprI family protein [Pseudomonadota bacterium]
MNLHLALALLLGQQDPWQQYNCDDPQYQAEMNRCAGLDFERADAELNALWREVIARAREADRDINREYDQAPTSEEVLRQAQRAWISFRDAHCTYEGHEARGGSMETMLYEGCRARLTRERIAQLRPQSEQ